MEEEEEAASLNWTMPKSPRNVPWASWARGLCPGTMLGAAQCSPKKGEALEGSGLEGARGLSVPFVSW